MSEVIGGNAEILQLNSQVLGLSRDIHIVQTTLFEKRKTLQPQFEHPNVNLLTCWVAVCDVRERSRLDHMQVNCEEKTTHTTHLQLRRSDDRIRSNYLCTRRMYCVVHVQCFVRPETESAEFQHCWSDVLSIQSCFWKERQVWTDHGSRFQTRGTSPPVLDERNTGVSGPDNDRTIFPTSLCGPKISGPENNQIVWSLCGPEISGPDNDQILCGCSLVLKFQDQTMTK